MGYGLGEWIQVNNYYIDRLDLMFFYNGIVLVVMVQNVIMYFWMQGFYVFIYYFWEIGVIGNFGYWQIFFC